jgi:hypothetical protein
VKEETLPSCLIKTAWTDEGELMGLRHREFVLEGVQFHPESFLTAEGPKILKNFMETKKIESQYMTIEEIRYLNRNIEYTVLFARNTKAYSMTCIFKKIKE